MMKKRTGGLAATALLIGLAGASVTGCGVGTVAPVPSPDCVVTDPNIVAPGECTDPSQESVAPIDRSGVVLGLPQN